MKKRTIVYHKGQKEDFGGVGVNHKPLKKNYRYIEKNILYKMVSFLLYYLLALPVLYIMSQVHPGIKVKGKREVKRALKGTKGYFIYGNHCHYYDAFIPHVYLASPKRTYVVSNPDAVNIPFIGGLVKMLGCLPLPSSLMQYKDFLSAMQTRLDEGGVVAIYPEGTMWPYYNKLRQIPPTSFKYAIMFNRPIVVASETFSKRKNPNKAPRLTVSLSAPIYPDQTLPEKERLTKLYNEVMTVLQQTVEVKENYSFHNYISF